MTRQEYIASELYKYVASYRYGKIINTWESTSEHIRELYRGLADVAIKLCDNSI